MAVNSEQADLLTIFLQSLLKLQNVERGSIWVKQKNGCKCVLALDEQSQSEGIEGIVISNKEPSIVGWVIENGKMTIARAGEDNRHYSEIENDLEIKSNIIICFPLVLDTGEVYGAVNLIDTTPTGSQLNLDKEYIDLLQNIVNVGSIALSRTLAYSKQLDENKKLKKIIDKSRGLSRIIGQSQGMLEVLDKAKTYAKVDYPVLITGESGTGKELFADEIHRLSPVSDKPYLIQNCSAIPETLLESELFGHKKGAFSGAIEDRFGLFEAADGGTVFLDEIGDMPHSLQAKILRFLDKGEIKPVGSTKTKRVKVRIIAATNIDLEAAIAKDNFREDLFYRLNVLPLHIPPLRERKDDIPLLLERFIHSESNNLGVKPKKISPETVQLLVQCHWKGNVRELFNFVRHIIVVAEGTIIEPDALPAYFFDNSQVDENSEPQISIKPQMRYPSMEEKPLSDYNWTDLERAYVLSLLEKNKWNISKAARISGLNRSTFNARLKKLGVSKR
jgi:transcriptional regulator with GAF, ATPase, and Fis domain